MGKAPALGLGKRQREREESAKIEISALAMIRFQDSLESLLGPIWDLEEA